MPSDKDSECEFGQIFSHSPRFQYLKTLGKGSYGVVCSAFDRATGRNVAIKKISKLTDPIVMRRTLREVKLLRHFRNSPNVVQLLEVLPVHDNETNEIYLVEELLDADLHTVIRSKQPLTEKHFQYFMFQILRAVENMHKANVLHRDLKPGNILVNVNCEAKICDFGLSRGIGGVMQEVVDGQITEYVATRWYRAPEIMLYKNYNSAADIWSLGCIFGELMSRKVMFPGKDHHHQLPTIISKLGPLPESMMRRIGSPKLKAYVESMTSCLKIDFESMFADVSPLAVDLLKKMLVYEPNQRITAHQALKHPYLRPYYEHYIRRNETKVSGMLGAVKEFDFSFEQSHCAAEIRQFLLDEVANCVNANIENSASVTTSAPEKTWSEMQSNFRGRFQI